METKRRRLLLADDSITIQKVVTLTFTDEGMDVTAVGSGDEAVRWLEESGPPDVLLADVHMPGLNGYQVCERVKRDARWRHVPVVLLAGAFEPFDEAEARRVGADDVLSKPFQSIKGLIGKVGSLLGGKHQEEGAPARAAASDVDPATATHEAAFMDTLGGETTLDGGTTLRAAAPESAPAPFADFGMDDQMIEATPAESFGAAAPSFGAAAPEAPTHAAPAAARDADEAEVWMGARAESPAFGAAPREVGAAAEAHAAVAQPRAFAAHAAGSATADEALLDIGFIDAPAAPAAAAAADPDDFVLDIDLDEPPPPPRPSQSLRRSRPCCAASSSRRWCHPRRARGRAKT